MFLAKRKGIYQLYYSGDNGRRTSVSTKTRYKNEALVFLSSFSKDKKEKEQRGYELISFKIILI